MNIASGSVFHRLRNTPLWDICRGRLNARLDWRAAIAASGLAPEVREVITQVVRRTRLWRSERVEVTEELIAHFHDGREAGRSPADLVETFGDPKLAAKLIRRGKIRNRSWVWHMQRWCWQALAVLIVVYVGAFAVLALQHPQPSVDYVAKMNTVALSVPEADKAWPIYRQAWIEGRIWELEKDFGALDAATAGGNSFRVRSGEPGWEKVGPFLSRHAGLIAAARAGAAKPHLGLVIGFDSAFQGEDRLALFGPEGAKETQDNFLNQTDRVDPLLRDSVFAVRLPHFRGMRYMGRLLALDLAWAAAASDGTRVVADYQALLGLAGQAPDDGTLVSQLVGVSIIDMANQTLADALHERGESFTAAQLTELANLAGRTEPLTRMTLTGEQGFMLDTIQRIYSDDGHGDGRITLDGLRVLERFSTPFLAEGKRFEAQTIQTLMLAGFPVRVALHASRRELTDMLISMYGEMEAQARQPLWVLLRSDVDPGKRLRAMHRSVLDRLRYEPLVSSMPSLSNAVRTGKQAQALGEAVAVALALELYHRRHGEYPAALAQLVPQYLPAAPLDHSTGQPLFYKLRDGKPLLYGRGLDGQDDGGVWDGKTVWPRVPNTGDWVLYPPQPR